MKFLSAKNARLSAVFIASTALLTSFGYNLEPIDEVFEPAGDFNPSSYGKVAVVQWAPTQDSPLGVTVEEAEAYKQEQRESLAHYIREAAGKGAKMVITPEFAVVGYPDIPELPPQSDMFQSREDIAPYVERIPGPTTDYFSALAKELGVYIHVGFAEVDAITDEYHNTVAVLDPSGKLLGSYRKIHLFAQENRFLIPGKEAFIYESPFGKVGITICSDIYSDEPIREHVEKGVVVNALSTSWAAWNSGMYAFQNGARRGNSYVLASNQTYFPDSGVINPDGSKQSHIRQSTGIAYGYLPYVKTESPTPSETGAEVEIPKTEDTKTSQILSQAIHFLQAVFRRGNR